MSQKKKGYDRGATARRLARERVGVVPASKSIQPKTKRKRPKHKKPPVAEEGA